MVSISAYHTPGVNGRKALGKATPLANSFSLIEYNEYFRFLIMDCPTNSTIPLYLKEFARLNVTDVVRVCEPTYDKERLVAHNVCDLPFKDGDVPPSSVIKKWLELVSERIVTAKQKQDEQPAPTTIAVHCVAGLGRAPVLVAVALIEKGTDPLDAIELVRRKRRGAFNNRQITYLADNYKRSSGSKGTAKLGSAIRQSPMASGTSPQASPSDSDATSPHAQAAGGSKPNSTSSTVSASRALFKKIFGSH
ncbi:hypothetical protein LPJ56_003757 [Coemansia sp. RSA 2599]|nr:hypothetical protein LPJ56_003757 [Coemansia sp. RSA 2599]